VILDPKNVTACLVTRGNVDMQPIIDTLPYGEVLVWDNSVEFDRKVFGRYSCARRASNPIVFWQDDDVIFTHHDELLAAYEPGTFVANNAHGPNTGGYDDLALQAAGALCPVELIVETWAKWFARYPIIDGFMEGLKSGRAGHPLDGLYYEADFIFGVLCARWKQIDLPYTRLYADDNTRLCRQPFQEALKFEMTERARAVRDGT
jgi:hypothetical protein